jgi:sugar/nucleoside kinase (ribokinase family)
MIATMTEQSQSADVIAAGHICLDLIPEITAARQSYGDLLRPGKLLNVGPVVTSTGGSVANTGVALHRLGARVRLLGKVGDDSFGRVVLDILKRHGNGLQQGMIVDPASDTSYTVVLSPPGLDRVFLHHPGANDTFTAGDIRDEHLTGARLFHFGYPPLMRRIYGDGGQTLATIFSQARSTGLVTSLDMSNPDPDSESGRVDWRAFLRRVLPLTDVFMPSVEEVSFMLGRSAPVDELVNATVLRDIADELLNMGAAIVGLKLGEHGLYLKAVADRQRLDALKSLHLDVKAWAGAELLAPCFQVNVVGATGSGDCTIAGFLAALLEGRNPAEAARLAVATGACNCEAPDATSGVRSRREIEDRIASGWKRHQIPHACGFEWDGTQQAARPAIH